MNKDRLGGFIETAKSLLKTTKRSLSIYKSIYPVGLYSRLAAIVVQILSNLSALYFGGRAVQALVDYIAGDNLDRSSVYVPIIIAGLLKLTEQLAFIVLGYFSSTSNRRMRKGFEHLFNTKSPDYSYEQHDDKDFAAQSHRLWNHSGDRSIQFINSSMDLIYSVLMLISSSFIIATVNPLLAVVIMASLLVTVSGEFKVAAIGWQVYEEASEQMRMLWRSDQQLNDPKLILETKILGTKGFLVNKVNSIHDYVIGIFEEKFNKVQKPIFIGSIISSLTNMGIQLWLGFRAMTNAGFGVGDFTFYSGTVVGFSGHFKTMIRGLARMIEHNDFMVDLYEYLDGETGIDQTVGVKVSKQKIPEIEFKNVSFKYPGSKNYIYKDLNFKISPKEKVALVGKNGAGKTTLIKLMLRLYDVTSGEVLVNGRNIKEVNLNDLYLHIGVLFQDFNEYPYTVKENITIGNHRARFSKKKLEKAIKDADAQGVIDKFPLGLDQYLEKGFKDGVRPSGGEWQKIALARAFYRDAGIVILDEPTAAIDSQAEFEIFKNLEKTQKDKTTIIVSHRFSTVRNASKIYVIDKGTIVEQGSHEQLMKNRALYEEMFSKQAAGYK